MMPGSLRGMTPLTNEELRVGLAIAAMMPLTDPAAIARRRKDRIPHYRRAFSVDGEFSSAIFGRSESRAAGVES